MRIGIHTVLKRQILFFKGNVLGGVIGTILSGTIFMSKM